MIVDAQSVKNSDTAGSKGYDAGKKVSGIKRHLAMDTQGLPHTVTITTADVSDRKYIGTQRNADLSWDSDCVARASDEERQRVAISSSGPATGWMSVYDAGTPTRKPAVTIPAFRLAQCQAPTEEMIAVSVELGEYEADPPPPPRLPPPKPSPRPVSRQPWEAWIAYAW